jgi:transcriptional regulator with XRE-family HTH domain
VSQWRNGDSVPDIYKFKKIAEFFGVSYEYLYGDSDSRLSENQLIADELRLSDSAIKALRDMISREGMSEIVSDMISSICFNEFVEAVGEVCRLHLIVEENKRTPDYLGDIDASRGVDKDHYKYSRYLAAQAYEQLLSNMEYECFTADEFNRQIDDVDDSE